MVIISGLMITSGSAGEGATFHRLLIPSKWAGAIIGKGGVMINKLRDEVCTSGYYLYVLVRLRISPTHLLTVRLGPVRSKPGLFHPAASDVMTSSHRPNE